MLFDKKLALQVIRPHVETSLYKQEVKSQLSLKDHALIAR